MRQLIWKELHEQAWKLGFASIVLMTFAAIAYRARLLSDEVTAMWICYISLTLLPITASTGLLPTERAEGTLEMLLSLPIRRWRVLLTKTLLGLAQVIVPILLAALVAIVICGGREIPTSSMLALHVRSATTGALLLAWMFALTARLPSEARAAMIAVGVLIIWELVTVGLSWDVTPRWTAGGHPIPLPTWPLIFTPLVFVYGLTEGFIHSPPLAVAVFVQAVFAAGLWALALVQLRVNDRVV